MGNDINIFFAHKDTFLLESPGTESYSCKNTGIPRYFAAKATTNEPVPPFEKTNLALMNNSIKKLCNNPNGIEKNISIILSKEKYLLIFPETITWVFMLSWWNISKAPLSLVLG